MALLAAVLLAAACAPLSDLGLDTRPIFIDQPIDATSRGRLLHATATPEQCTAWLAAAGIGFRPVADRTEDTFCQVSGAGALIDTPQGDARLFPAKPMMACPLAAAMALWRRQSVEPAAREILGAEVRQIDHLGVYACRNVNNQADGRPSAHARAEAIDVAGFRLSNGQRVTIAKNWAGDSPQARFLHRIRDDACHLFGTTLSPDYNALHANHLHLESGPPGACS
jgi:hypothetical protein